LLSTVGLGSFKTSHLQIHHHLVGTPLDFSTARRGQSLYGFWRQSLVGNFYDAFRAEHKHLAKAGRSMWHSELLIWYGWTVLWLAIAILLWGAVGAVFFVVQGFIAVMKLDCINYLQHYAMVRNRLPNGHFEHVQPHHTWSNDRIIDDFVLLNLPRHAEHHVHAHTPDHLLRPQPTSPQYPYCYGWMCLIALVPPLFWRIVHPYLEANEQSRLVASGELLISRDAA
jgi:alkane 1-monooxygenase